MQNIYFNAQFIKKTKLPKNAQIRNYRQIFHLSIDLDFIQTTPNFKLTGSIKKSKDNLKVNVAKNACLNEKWSFTSKIYMSLNALEVEFFLFQQTFIPCSETIHSFRCGVLFFFYISFITFLYTFLENKKKLYKQKWKKKMIKIINSLKKKKCYIDSRTSNRTGPLVNYKMLKCHVFV